MEGSSLALALTVVLTVVGGLLTILAWKRRGTASALRIAGITVLVPAAYLTGALPLLVDIGQGIASWATRLVFSPVVWTGVGLAGVGVLLVLAGGAMRERGRGVTAHRSGGTVESAGGTPAGRPKQVAPAKQEQQGARGGASDGASDGGAEGMDDIEAILRKRGIT